MLKTEDREIGGRTFRVTQMPGTKALRMFTRITKIAGPAIGELARDERELGKLLEQDVGSLGMAIATLCADLDPDEIESIAKTLAGYSKVNLEGAEAGAFVDLVEVVFDDVFGGRIDRLLGWLAFSLEVNFSSFLAGRRPGGANDSTGDVPGK